MKNNAAMEDHWSNNPRFKETLAEQPAQLDPSVGTQVSKVWWDGDKLMAQPIPLEKLYKEPEQPAQQQEPHCYMDEYGNVHGGYEDWMENEGGWFPVYTSPPVSKPLSGYINAAGINANDSPHIVVEKLERAIEANLKEKNGHI